ncbi:MAG TPA: DUF4402 domain-containing protein [Bacteroidales bacterium]|nr:DUF4402 domain-containing protein [Bacteroidales bacterium]
MKFKFQTYKKKFRLYILVIICSSFNLSITTICYGQSNNSSASIGIPIKAKLVSGLTVNKERNLRFGTIIQGNGKVNISPTDVNAGLFRIVGRKGSEVYCNLTPPKNLVDGKGHTIPFNANAAYNNKKRDPTTAIQFQKASGAVDGFDLKANPQNNEAEAYIWIYGSIDVGKIKPGDYTGTFTLSVTY